MASIITIETGLGVTDSNSYVSIDDIDAYLETLGEDPATSNDWLSLEADQKGEAIILAAQYLDHMVRWYGLPYWPSRPFFAAGSPSPYLGGSPGPRPQSMQWPRTKVIDSHGAIISPGTIPTEVKLAQMYLALEFCTDPSEAQVTIENVSPVKSMRIGPMGMDFVSSRDDSAITQFSGTRYPYVEFLLKNLGIVRDEIDLRIRKTENQK